MRLRAHRFFRVFAAVTALAAIGGFARVANGQCTPGWDVGPTDGLPDFDEPVSAVTHWDPDGPGPAPEIVVFGGKFLNAGYAGGVNHVVGWDGEHWFRFGDGLPYEVVALGTFRGQLIASYAGEDANHHSRSGISFWDGGAWHDMSAGLVEAAAHRLVEFGDMLVASPGWSGNFELTDHTSAALVYWNGESWVPFPQAPPWDVFDVTVWNGQLAIAGSFYAWVDGQSREVGVLVWDGTWWRALASNTPLMVTTLGVYQGELLIASFGWSINYVGGVKRWDGQSWQFMGDVTQDDIGVSTFVLWQGNLVAAGSGNPLVWNGEHWTSTPTNNIAAPLLLTALGDSLIGAGSDFRDNDVVTYRYGAQWDGAAWHPLGGGPAGGHLTQVSAVGVHEGRVFVGGRFAEAGGKTINGIAEWTPEEWKPVGDGFYPDRDVVSVFSFNGDLCAAGSGFALGGEVVRWDGTAWRPLGQFTYGVSCVVEHQGDLFMDSAIDDVRGLLRLDGSQWTVVSPAQEWFWSLTSFGTDLVAIGDFDSVAGVPAKRVARWDGAVWHAMGTGITGWVGNAIVFNQTLFIGGLNVLGPGSSVALWNGNDWLPAGQDQPPSFRSFLVWDGDLFAVTYAMNLYRWDGVTWQALAANLGVTADPLLGDCIVNAIVPYGESLLVGGTFWTTGDHLSPNFARWRDPQPPSITGPVESVITCPGSTAAFAVTATGSQPVTFRWRRDGVDLADGVTAAASTVSGSATASLAITNVSPDDAGAYTCAVTNNCATVVSASAALVVCLADFDCNGFVNGEDMDAFNAAFDAGDSSADVNRDGFVTGDDFDEFTAHFDAGC